MVAVKMQYIANITNNSWQQLPVLIYWHYIKREDTNMIHVDMDALRAKWYQMGLAGQAITGDDKVLYNSLDQWQKQELRNEYLKAAGEVVESWDHS